MSANTQDADVPDMRKVANLQKRTNRFLKASEIGLLCGVVTGFANILLDPSELPNVIRFAVIVCWAGLFLSFLAIVFFRNSDEYTRSLWHVATGPTFSIYALIIALEHLLVSEIFSVLSTEGFAIKSAASSLSNGILNCTFFLSIVIARHVENDSSSFRLPEITAPMQKLRAYVAKSRSMSNLRLLQRRTNLFLRASEVRFAILILAILDADIFDLAGGSRSIGFVGTVIWIAFFATLFITFRYRNADEYSKELWNIGTSAALAFLLVFHVSFTLSGIGAFYIFGFDPRPFSGILVMTQDFGLLLVFFCSIQIRRLAKR